MKFNNTIELVSGMKSIPRGGVDGKEPAARSKASPKVKTAPPPPKFSRTHKPDDVALEDWQRALRRQFGEQQPFVLKNVGGHPLFSEFALTNPESGKTYKIAIRGEAPARTSTASPALSCRSEASSAPPAPGPNSTARRRGSGSRGSRLKPARAPSS